MGFLDTLTVEERQTWLSSFLDRFRDIHHRHAFWRFFMTGAREYDLVAILDRFIEGMPTEEGTAWLNQFMTFFPIGHGPDWLLRLTAEPGPKKMTWIQYIAAHKKAAEERHAKEKLKQASLQNNGDVQQLALTNGNERYNALQPTQLIPPPLHTAGLQQPSVAARFGQTTVNTNNEKIPGQSVSFQNGALYQTLDTGERVLLNDYNHIHIESLDHETITNIAQNKNTLNRFENQQRVRILNKYKNIKLLS